MPTPVQSEIPFDVRMRLRENVLAWISRDVGLSEFLVPEALTAAWTEEQRQAWTSAIIEKYMDADTGKSGQLARKRVLACETAGSLTRSCMQLRQHTASHRDVMKTSVALESLWDSISNRLDDSTWHRCSLLFDTALISLRVAYLWMYLKAEASGAQSTLDTRKSLFRAAVKGFFTSEAPTDDSVDKHSDNFKKLLEVWRQELDKYHADDQFESRMTGLEKTQNLAETAACIEKFLTASNVDKNWVVNMHNIDTEIEKGIWTRKGKGKGKGRSSKANGKSSKQRAAATVDYDEPTSPESASSFEPLAPDSDFDIKEVEEEENDEEDSGSTPDDDLPAVRSRRLLGVYEGRTRQASMTERPISHEVFYDYSGSEIRDARAHAEKRRAALKAKKLAQDESHGEDEPETPESSVPHHDSRLRRSNRNAQTAGMPDLEDVEDAIGLNDSPRMTRSTERRRAMKSSESPYTERPARALRSREAPQEERVRQRVLRRTHAEMAEGEAHNNGPMEFDQTLASRESRRRRVQAALEADVMHHSERMVITPDVVRRSSRTARK